MENGDLPMHRRAVMALNELPVEEQAIILAALAKLAAVPVDEWPAHGVRRLALDPSLFILRAGDSLRILLRVADGRLGEVADIVRRETLQAFAK